MTLGVTDRPDSISGQSEYAKHIIGGILRDVTLVALPVSHLTRLHADTTFGASCTDAILTVTAAAALAAGKSGTVDLRLTDAAHQTVALLELAQGARMIVQCFQIISPTSGEVVSDHPGIRVGAEYPVLEVVTTAGRVHLRIPERPHVLVERDAPGLWDAAMFTVVSSRVPGLSDHGAWISRR
ncbi:hypothetical protein ABZY68_16410 [Streptomyces sp. NPDC006482]|uniref:hypothetical protein n=1 Tax=Streptomyces sp. NPDC006482 TaxID=3154306 RepID=UPI0033A7BA9E